ncbi:hypothetical protein JRG66_06360 [Salinimicrobium tongyeongense]|jgi:multidrug transporter EmrE-like cation transporter|uniref:Uncharacterized protein n=1 Tax=Salinimicrobium tongyeongense TaxID=2809707 RepID=A0ABY6NU88_9FLAO|nr:hypothetical protein [Salinimicrobium tongyeongense]UZH56479.1 hypothetical protein JRG66_06360 [Salinimicrobium tongyeongense]
MTAEEGNSKSHEPQLYSKSLILIFALLFSTIFAAVLLMSNLRTLGKKKESGWVLLFAVVYLFTTALLMQALSLSPSMTAIANVIGAAILNEFFWNKFIGRDLQYHKKSWIKPILIAVGIALLLFFFLMGSM